MQADRIAYSNSRRTLLLTHVPSSLLPQQDVAEFLKSQFFCLSQQGDSLHKTKMDSQVTEFLTNFHYNTKHTGYSVSPDVFPVQCRCTMATGRLELFSCV